MGNTNCYSNSICAGTPLASAATGTDYDSCLNFCISEKGASFFVYDNTITNGGQNCFCYDTCTPSYVANPASVLANSDGDLANCPALPFEVCSLAPGWQCGGTPDASTSGDPSDVTLEWCSKYCQQQNVDFTYATLIPGGGQAECECFSKDNCASSKYTANSTSGVVQYKYPDALACPLLPVDGAKYVGEGLICKPETTIFPPPVRRDRSLAALANDSPQDCYDFCVEEADGINYFNFYPDPNNGGASNICGCCETCGTTLAVPGGLRYKMCEEIDPSDYVDSAFKLHPVKYVKPGQSFRLTFTLTAPWAKGFGAHKAAGMSLPDGTNLRLELPSDILSVQKATLIGGAKGLTTADKQGVVVVDGEDDIVTVTWSDLNELFKTAPNGRIKPLKFTIVTKVKSGATAEDVLDINAYFTGDTCDVLVDSSSTVEVRSAHKAKAGGGGKHA